MTAAFEPLSPCESQLSDATEDLFRQIPSHNWDSTVRRPKLEAFGPATADKKMPSYSRSTVTTAAASRQWHNENANSESLAVYAVPVGEVDALGTRTVDDSDCTDDQAPGHCYVDFRHLTKLEERVLRAKIHGKSREVDSS